MPTAISLSEVDNSIGNQKGERDMLKNKERKLMTYKPIFAKRPRSTLCLYHSRGHHDKQELGTKQNESEASSEDEGDSRVNSVV